MDDFSAEQEERDHHEESVARREEGATECLIDARIDHRGKLVPPLAPTPSLAPPGSAPAAVPLPEPATQAEAGSLDQPPPEQALG